MTVLSETEMAEIEEEEERRIFREIQREQEAQGKIPAAPVTVLQRNALPLRYVADVLFGLGVGLVAMIGGFYLFTTFLHLEY